LNWKNAFLSMIFFQDFPDPGIFKKKIQDFPGGVGTLSHGHAVNH